MSKGYILDFLSRFEDEAHLFLEVWRNPSEIMNPNLRATTTVGELRDLIRGEDVGPDQDH